MPYRGGGLAVNEPTVRECFIYAALSLAGHYFPRHDAQGKILAPFREAAFFASRKPQVWDQWARLSFEERRRIADVMSIAPPELAEERYFAREARTLLGALEDLGESEESGPELRRFILAGENPAQADAAYPNVGGDLLGHADRVTARFRRPSSRRKALEFAGPGTWKTRDLYVGQEMVHGKLTIPVYPHFKSAPEHDVLPAVTTRPYQKEIAPTVEELKSLALAIESRYEKEEERYLHFTLSRLFEHLKAADTDRIDVFRLLSGHTQILNAPTGTGKSVLVRVLASWFAVNDLRVTLVVPDVKATLSTVWQIKQDLEHLHDRGELKKPATCAPLMSPSSLYERTLKHASLINEGDPGEWGERGLRDVDRLGHGCAQEKLIESAGTYRRGQENCIGLRQDKSYAACPWIPTCGKFAPVYEACNAAVVVTNHHNFIQGNVRIGVQIDERAIRDVTVRELVLRLSDAVVIDEIDAFQATAIDKCASQMVLHSRRPGTADPQVLDTDAKRLPTKTEAGLLNPISHVRLMAESLLLGICDNALHLNARDDERAKELTRDYRNDGWRLARSRDRDLIPLLFPDMELAEGQAIPREAMARLDALLPERYGTSDSLAEPEVQLGPEWNEVRNALSALVGPRGEDHRDMVKLELHERLTAAIPDPRKRSRAINLLLVRVYMRELDQSLDALREKAQQLRHLGLVSAHRILDSLKPRAIASVLPLGMVGRSISGYRVKGLEDREKDAELSVQALSGDPHTYVSELGGLVSLLTARVERPVMGLSATAFFPQAVREHVHAPVTWWMTDAQARSIVAESHRLTYNDEHRLAKDPIRIAGTHPTGKPEALVELASRLYENKISKKIARLRKKDPKRARVILTANSYDQCAWLALGLTRARGFEHRVCVAVRNEDPLTHARQLPPEDLVSRITTEQFEDFPDQGDILIAPLSVIARGLNIVVGTRSAVESIYLCVRPVLSIEDTPWTYGSVNAAGISTFTSSGVADPVPALARAAQEANEQLGRILRSSPQFSTMTHILQEQVVAGMLVNLIQLAGRARRGGTSMGLHLVDYAFQDDTWSSDLVTVIKRLHSRWPTEVRQRMNDLYGEALGAFLSYAGIDPAEIA